MRQLTIGIPSYNEQKNIRSLLASLESQYLSGFAISEVLISDDSSDNTADMVRDFATKSSLNIKLLHHENRRGAAAAWNEIFREAIGEIIVLYDADIIPHPNCTHELASSLDNSKGISLCASNPLPVQVDGIAGRGGRFISNWLRAARRAGLSQYTVMGRALAVDSRIARDIIIPADVIAIDLYLQCMVLEARANVVYNDSAIVYFRPAANMAEMASQIIRAANGHDQLQAHISKLEISLPSRVVIAQALCQAAADLPGALSAAIGFSLVPYYRIKLSGTNSAKWHTAESSKTIDYERLRASFSSSC